MRLAGFARYWRPAGAGECRTTQNTYGPLHEGVAVRIALEYTFGIPRPAGSAGLGAHAWRKVGTEEAAKREFYCPELTRL